VILGTLNTILCNVTARRHNANNNVYYRIPEGLLYDAERDLLAIVKFLVRVRTVPSYCRTLLTIPQLHAIIVCCWCGGDGAGDDGL